MIWLLSLFSRLPFFILYGISNFLFLIAFYLVGYRRKMVYQNLKNSFPDKSDREIRQFCRAFYLNLSDLLVETLKSLTISKKALKSRIRISNPELFTSFMQNEQSILLMTSHYANWEWMLLGCGAHDLPPIHPIYKPLSNKSMDQMMNRIRSRFGSQPIPKDNTIMSIIQRKKYQEAYGIVGDQAPYHLEEKYWTQFLHQDTAFYEGAEKIARLTKFPVLFAHMQRHKRGYYEITFEVLAEPPYKKMPQNELIEAYVKALEKQILAGPSDWLWTHNRWKYHRGLYE